jgi:uncharacterized protein YjiS (DUF1127 family)
MYTDTNIAPAIAPAALSRPLKDRVVSYLAALRDHHRETLDLIRLRDMDDHMLSDIGVTRDEALRSMPRPVRHFVR